MLPSTLPFSSRAPLSVHPAWGDVVAHTSIGSHRRSVYLVLHVVWFRVLVGDRTLSQLYPSDVSAALGSVWVATFPWMARFTSKSCRPRISGLLRSCQRSGPSVRLSAQSSSGLWSSISLALVRSLSVGPINADHILVATEPSASTGNDYCAPGTTARSGGQNQAWRYSMYIFGAMTLVMWVIRFFAFPIQESPVSNCSDPIRKTKALTGPEMAGRQEPRCCMHCRSSEDCQDKPYHLHFDRRRSPERFDEGRS